MMARQGKTVSQQCACLQYALLMMPIAAAIEEKIPAMSPPSSYAKLGSEGSQPGKRWASSVASCQQMQCGTSQP